MNSTIKFDIQISGSSDMNLVKIEATGDLESLDIFKFKVQKLFKDGGKERIRHRNQKLTEEQVSEIKKIRREKGWGRTRLSRKFNVGKTTIERILSGDTWKDIE
jgi:ribosome-binding protein aMBF1 (putative translation factor)